MTDSFKLGTLGWLVVLLTAIFPSFLRGESNSPAPAPQTLEAPYKNTFFDPDPNHPWNVLYGMLFMRPGWDGRIYGLNEMDPLYWDATRYLLEEPLHHKALGVLDEFIKTDSVRLIKDPLKRALLQRMLWALFDTWAYHSVDGSAPKAGMFETERRELQMRLVKIMKRVALTDDEIKNLPDNYNMEAAAKTYPTDFDPTGDEKAFLPAAFFSGADWADLNGTNYDLLAPVHVQNISGRSGFHVLISLPSGRKETLAYLKSLHDFQPHWIYKNQGFTGSATIEPPWANPELPQVPPLTKFALVRRAHLIDAKGEVVSTPITESIQIRVIRTITPNHSSGGEQSFFMFTLDQTQLMAGKGGLVALDKKSQSFDMVFRAVLDYLQNRDKRNPDSSYHGEFARVTGCQGCHSAPGIFSMNSYIQFFQNNRSLKPPDLREGDDADWSSMVWKQKQYTWGLLQAYWFGQD